MKKNERFVITINRELGSGGRTVGRVLAEKLGVPYYDKVLSKALEEKFDLSHRQIEELKGKNRSWWEEIKRVLVLGEGAANSSEYYDEDNNRYVTSEAVLKAEREILQNIAKMDELGFGNCTNTRACEAVCPKNETIANIARLNREMIKAKMAD